MKTSATMRSTYDTRLLVLLRGIAFRPPKHHISQTPQAALDNSCEWGTWCCCLSRGVNASRCSLHDCSRTTKRLKPSPCVGQSCRTRTKTAAADSTSGGQSVSGDAGWRCGETMSEPLGRSRGQFLPSRCSSHIACAVLLLLLPLLANLFLPATSADRLYGGQSCQACLPLAMYVYSV